MKQHDYLATLCWYGEVITDPYLLMTEFFMHGDIAYWRKLIKRMLLHVGSNKIYRKNAPGDLVFECKMLESLMCAADIIRKAKKRNRCVINEDDLFNKKWFCGRHNTCSEWDYFPKSLSQKEYIDPYRVFTKFFTYQNLDKWKQDLQEILTYALTKNTEGVRLDLLAIYLHLTKLVEAVHLVEVRGK